MPNATAPVSVGQIVAVGSEPAQIGDEAVVGLGDGHLAVARQDDAVADGPHQVAAARQNHQLGLVAARRHCVAENRSNKNQKKTKQTNKQTRYQYGHSFEPSRFRVEVGSLFSKRLH